MSAHQGNDDALLRLGKHCPHAEDIRFCPLYIASHAHAGLGCVGQLDAPCMVEAGEVAFAEAVEDLRKADPLMVAQAEWCKRQADATAQRRRNMTALGIR